MKIVHFNIWSRDKNLGKAYNEHMQMLNDDDWAVFTDGDVCYITTDWGNQIEDFIKLNPNAGLITCYTNRIAFPAQRVDRLFNNERDIVQLAKIADYRRKKFHLKSLRINKKIGGFFFALKKSTWNDIKFDESIGMLGVDGDYSERILRAGYDIMIMQGLYVFHFYRFLTGRKNKEHLRLSNGKMYGDGCRYDVKK